MSKLNAMGLALLGCIAPIMASADEFDGSRPLICATIDTVECGANSACLYGPAESINFPQFFRINFLEKTISGTRVDGTEAATNIKSLTSLEDDLILQGIEGGRGWTMAITQSTGKLVVAASADQAGFVVFGACTLLGIED